MRTAILLGSALLLAAAAARAQDTRDLNLGGAVNVDEDAVNAPTPRAPRPDTVDDLPVVDRPLPKADSPEYVPFLWERFRAYHGVGRYKEACEDLDLLRATGDDLSSARDMAGRTYLACAQKHAEQKDEEPTLGRLLLARQLIGEVAEMKRVRGAVARLHSEQALAKGNFDDAIAAFEEAYQLEPDATDKLKFSADMAYLARTAYQRDDVETTRKAIEVSLRYFPDNLEAHELQRQLWIRSNFGLMVGAAFLAVLALVGVYLLLRRAGASKYEKIDPDALPDLDDDDEQDGEDARF